MQNDGKMTLVRNKLEVRFVCDVGLLVYVSRNGTAVDEVQNQVALSLAFAYQRSSRDRHNLPLFDTARDGTSYERLLSQVNSVSKSLDTDALLPELLQAASRDKQDHEDQRRKSKKWRSMG